MGESCIEYELFIFNYKDDELTKSTDFKYLKSTIGCEDSKSMGESCVEYEHFIFNCKNVDLTRSIDFKIFKPRIGYEIQSRRGVEDSK
jgi:hypothetical protein